jgi:hypothetical protein
MMGFPEAMVALIVVGLPILVLGYLFHRWFQLKEKKPPNMRPAMRSSKPG